MTELDGNFDDIARNLAEAVDEILVAVRSRDRRLALIAHQVRRALGLGYKAGIARASKDALSTSDDHARRGGKTPHGRL
jgi:hypothetical protein